MRSQEPSSPAVISITGGTGAGKTSLVKAICSTFPEVAILDQDSYYADHAGLSAEEKDSLNYDHPSAVDHDTLFDHLCDLMNGKAVEKPRYCFASHSRERDTELVKPAPLIIVEGIFGLWDARIRTLTNLKIYVEAAPDVRFIRRLERDVVERGRTMQSVIRQYLESVRPMHRAFIDPLKVHADLVIDGTEQLSAALAAVRDALGRLQPSSPPEPVYRLEATIGPKPSGTQTSHRPHRTNGSRNADHVSSTVDWNLLTTGIRNRVRATGAAVFALEDENLVCVARSGKTAPEMGVCFNAPSELLSEFTQDGNIVSTEPRSHTDCARYCPGARCSVAIPLSQSNRLVGIFQVFSDEKDVFSGSDIDSLKIFAELIVKMVDTPIALPRLLEGKAPEREQVFPSVETTLPQPSVERQEEAVRSTRGQAFPTWGELCQRIIADYENSPEAQSDRAAQLELEAVAEKVPGPPPMLSEHNSK
ncbi:MAG: uridine kinase [Acidobacteria bacterium]|nr:MAG: uridine kinase [Acidobacteriota bacterium]